MTATCADANRVEGAALAVDSYRTEPGQGMLDLRWSPDEVEYVEPALRLAWRELTRAGPTLLDLSRRYDVTDPFGAQRARAPVSRHFGWPVEPGQLTVGAGTTGLLHSLCMLAGRGIATSPLGHPDLPTWVHRSGGTIWPIDPRSDLDAAVALVRECRPGLVVVEAPDILGRPCPSAADLHQLAEAASSVDALLVLDEAQANYLGPAASAAWQVADLDCLVALRSMSKGYCCGGLRVGYAVASPPATVRLRSVAPPLAASAMPFEIAMCLLGQGDVFTRLRARIAEVKPLVSGCLTALGLTVTAGHPHLPWLTAQADEATLDILDSRGIAAKHLTLGPPGTVRRSLIKLAVPLSEDRVRRFRAACVASMPSEPAVPSVPG